MLSFVADFETLLQLSLHLCQFTCTLPKNAYSAFSPYLIAVVSEKCMVTPSFPFGFQ